MVTLFLFVVTGVLFQEPVTSPLAKEVIPQAIKWREAVMQHKTDALVAFGLPEEKEFLSKELRDPESSLHKQLFQKGGEDFVFFSVNPNSRPIVFNNVGTPNRSTTVCFASEKNPPIFPKTAESVANFSDGKRAVCRVFFEAEGHWYISYGFAFSEDY